MSSPYVLAVFVGLGVGSIYALIAIGYNLVYSSTGVFNFAQGDLVSFGGLFAFTFVVTHHLPALVGLLMSVLGVALVGLVQQQVSVAPVLRGQQKALAWIVTTLGASVIMENIAQLVWGSQPLEVPAWISNRPINLAGAHIQIEYLVIFGVAVSFGLGLDYASQHSLIGKVWSATAEDSEAAEAQGIDTRRVGIIAFVLAAAVSGLAGFVTVPVTGALWSVGSSLTLNGFVAIALGGFMRAKGALIGGLILGIVETEAAVTINPQLEDAVALGVLIIILLIRPNGLFSLSTERAV